MTVELLACPTPWCQMHGGEPYVFERRKDALGVYCPTCSVSTPYFPTREAAVECWNTRPSLEGVAGLVEAAKQMRVRLRHDDNCPALTDSSCEYSSCECGIAEIALNFDAALATFRDQGGR